MRIEDSSGSVTAVAFLIRAVHDGDDQARIAVVDGCLPELQGRARRLVTAATKRP